MRKSIRTFALLLFSLFLAAAAAPTEASAQCLTGTVYVTSFAWQSSAEVYGYSSTELDYCAGFYYDPATWGRFSEGNWATEAPRMLSTQYTEGSSDYIPADIYYSYGYPVNGQYYNVDTQHYIIAYYQVYVEYWGGGGYYWYDPWMLGFIGDPGWGWGFEGPGLYGYGYSYYWVAVPQTVANTFHTILYEGQSQCPPGQMFTPTGINCGDPPPPPTPPIALSVQIHDKNGNNITNTLQTVMLGSPTKLSAITTSPDSNVSFSWSLGNQGESSDFNSQTIFGTWTLEGDYVASVTASRNGAAAATAQVNIKVMPPTLESLQGQQNAPQIAEAGGTCENSLTLLILGCRDRYYAGSVPDAGVEITSSVVPPANDISSPTQAGPKTKFVQLVNPYDRRFEQNPVSTRELCLSKRASPEDTETGWVLDAISNTSDAYGGEMPIPIREANTIASFVNGRALGRMLDFPQEELVPSTSGYNLYRLSKDHFFETYVVYFFKTQNGTLVERVLGVIKWNWRGKADFDFNTNKFRLDTSFSRPAAPMPISGSSVAAANSVSQFRTYYGNTSTLSYKNCSSQSFQFDSAVAAQSD